jgi:hypothetical protein
LRTPSSRKWYLRVQLGTLEERKMITKKGGSRAMHPGRREKKTRKILSAALTFGWSFYWKDCGRMRLFEGLQGWQCIRLPSRNPRYMSGCQKKWDYSEKCWDIPYHESIRFQASRGQRLKISIYGPVFPFIHMGKTQSFYSLCMHWAPVLRGWDSPF